MKKYLAQQECSRHDEVSIMVQMLGRCEQDGIHRMELDLDKVRLDISRTQDGRMWVEVTAIYLPLASVVRKRIFERFAGPDGNETESDDGIVFRFFLKKQ